MAASLASNGGRVTSSRSFLTKSLGNYMRFKAPLSSWGAPSACAFHCGGAYTSPSKVAIGGWASTAKANCYDSSSTRPFNCLGGSRRGYLHFGRSTPEDYELPMDTMPKDVDTLMRKDPRSMDFFENYWYWRIRGEASVLDAEALPKKSYKQLARDMGMQVVNEQSEHMIGLMELYEYLKSSPFVGPFGTIENPVLVPSVHTQRVVGCTGGTGDSEHVPLWFRCREGFLYRCGECDQIFMLVRVIYSLPDGVDPFPVDPDVDDVFDVKLIEKGQKMWNAGDYVHWPVGHESYKQLFLGGKWGNEPPKHLQPAESRLVQ